MATLTFREVEDLWTANGGDPGWAPLMAGIAWAESGLRTEALNNTPATQDYSVGLWQINYYDYLRADRTARYGSPEALIADPNLQAKAAIDIFGPNGAGSGAWKTDRMYEAWKAAGFPSKPDSATVTGWVGGNIDTRDQPAGSSYNPLGGADVTVSGAGGQKHGCNTGSKGISIGAFGLDAVSGVGNACQIKALTGGLMVGLGGAMLIGGLVLIVAAVAAGTKAGQAAAGAVGSVVGGPAGGLIGSSAAQALGSSSKPRKPSGGRAAAREEREVVQRIAAAQADRDNPSEARRQYMADRAAARRYTTDRAAGKARANEPF